MTTCKGCGRDMDRQSTHWEGCHTSHPECAAYKAGREAGMREAADLCGERWRAWFAKYGGSTAYDAGYISGHQTTASAILAAIGEGE